MSYRLTIVKLADDAPQLPDAVGQCVTIDIGHDAPRPQPIDTFLLWIRKSQYMVLQLEAAHKMLFPEQYGDPTWSSSPMPPAELASDPDLPRE